MSADRLSDEQLRSIALQVGGAHTLVDLYRALAAQLAAVRDGTPPKDAHDLAKCGHSSYWRTLYGNCMACRAEKAESQLTTAQTAQAQAEGERDAWNARWNKKCERLQSRLAAMEGALKAADHELERNEWIRGADSPINLSTFLTCPSCGANEVKGHYQGCMLADVRKQAAHALTDGGREEQVG